jgi:hypothetical protein
MSESKPKVMWSYIITAFLIAIMLSGTAVYISYQQNQTQRDIAEKQVKAINELTDRVGVGAENIQTGLNGVKTGICKLAVNQLFAYC